MNESNPSGTCGFKGLVQSSQTGPDGELRVEAAAALVADALDGFLALRRASAQPPAEASAAASPKVLAMALDQVDAASLRMGEIASCWISQPADASARGAVEARLDGPRGVAWRATVQLGSVPPAPAPPDVAAAPAPVWPPLRVLRPMRKPHCDQAGHVNVQVFMDLADEACAVLGLEAIGDGPGPEIVQARISFKRELFEGDVVAVHSGIQEVHAQGLKVVHGIVHRPSGALACVVETQLAVRAPITVAPAEQVGDWPSLPLARPPAGPRPDAEPSADAVTTSLSVVDAWDVDRTGRLSARALVDLCSTGARQYLSSIGLSGARFLREQITVAAVDYLLDIRQRPALGCNLALRSAFLSGSAKSIRFSHHLVDAEAGTVYATVEIVGVMLDLTTHRSMEVPKDVRQRLGMTVD